MQEYIKDIADISNDIKLSIDNISQYRDNLTTIVKRVTQTCTTVIIEISLIDEYDYNIFLKETLPKMKEYVQYKTELILKIINLFQKIYYEFNKYLEEIKIKRKLCEKIKNIRKELDTLIQDISFYRSV